MTTLITGFVGILTGIIIVMLSELVKKNSQRRTVASRILADSLLTINEIADSDSIPFVATAKKIYADPGLWESKQKLEDHLNVIRTSMKADLQSVQNWIDEITKDKIKLDKYLFIGTVTENQYQADKLILSKSEMSILPSRIQVAVCQKIENQFYSAVCFRFLIEKIRIGAPMDQIIDEIIEFYRYTIKTYRDRDFLYNYSKKISKDF